MPMTTGGFANLLTKAFEKIFFDEYMRQPEEYKSVAKMSNESTHYVREGDMYGLGAMQEMAEAQAIPFETFTQGNEKTVYFTDFGLGVQFSRNMYDDDLTGHMKKAIAELGKSAGYTKDLKFWDILNSGELPAARVGLDGEALFVDDHPVEGVPGDTLSNVVDAALSKTSLQGAIDLMEGLTNEKGIPIVMKPSKLIIPYQLKWLAKELMLSELDPESANNAVNSLQGEGLSYQVCHYLTDPNAAYLLSNDHDLRFMWRRPAGFKGTDDFNTDNALFKGTMRFQTTFFHWRGAVKITGG
jgi:phage major head subunit gpT-like protein